MGFKEAVERICSAAKAARQTLLFTATLDRTMAELASRLLRDPVRIQIEAEKVTHDNIEQRLHVADGFEHKKRILQHLVTDGTLSQAIVFSGTKIGADQLARELSAQGHRAAALHGDMTQGARNRTIEQLRRGRIRLLIATDVAARGLDVSGISHVINFDLPMNAEDYVHRIGRTGRAGASGIAISLASRDDAMRLKRIEGYIGRTLPHETIPGLEPTVTLFAPRGNRPGGTGGKRSSGGWSRGNGGRPGAGSRGPRTGRPSSGRTESRRPN
jgi:superfamily II DNA/RNA helicase